MYSIELLILEISELEWFLVYVYYYYITKYIFIEHVNVVNLSIFHVT